MFESRMWIYGVVILNLWVHHFYLLASLISICLWIPPVWRTLGALQHHDIGWLVGWLVVWLTRWLMWNSSNNTRHQNWWSNDGGGHDVYRMKKTKSGGSSMTVDSFTAVVCLGHQSGQQPLPQCKSVARVTMHLSSYPHTVVSHN